MLVYIAFGLPMVLAVALLAADVYYLRLLVLIMLDDDQDDDVLELDHPLDPGPTFRHVSRIDLDDLAARRVRRGDAS